MTETTKKIAVIRDRILRAQSRQKSYANKRRRLLEFEIGDFVMLKVSPMKGVKRFGKKGKLAPRYIRPFKIIERIGVISYHLELPNSLAYVHDIFHVSMLRKHLRDEKQQHVIEVSELHLQSDITTEKTTVRFLVKETKKLRNKIIPLVKVQWNREGMEEALWEPEEDMHRDYP